MTRRSRAPGGARGLTLLEVTVSTSILTALLAITFTLLGNANDLSSRDATLADLRSRARIAADRIARELRDSGPNELSPQPLAPLGASSLRYRRAAGYAGGAIAWGEQSEIAWRLAPGEVEDGGDNDGDGLVDEGRVVWTPSTSTPTAEVVLCEGVARYGAGETGNAADDDLNGLVDERGLSFDLAGRVLTVRLTLERRTRGQERLQVSVATTVLLQNP